MDNRISDGLSQRLHRLYANQAAKLVIPVGEEHGYQELLVVEVDAAGEINKRKIYSPTLIIGFLGVMYVTSSAFNITPIFLYISECYRYS